MNKPDLEHKKICRKCKYSKAFQHNGQMKRYDQNIYCDYLLMTGSMRPCPADQCTVFEPRPVNEKFKRGPGIII